MATAPLLEVTQLSHTYDGLQLRFPDFTLGGGQLLVLSGPSGAGKSTLLHLLAGVLQPKAQANARILFAGRDLLSASGRREQLRPHHVGWMPQRPQLLPGLSLLENVCLPLAFCVAPGGARTRAGELLERLGLGSLAGRRGLQLSVGETARACLARALITRPQLLLADEPSAALDDDAAERVTVVLREYLQAGGAAIIASHDAGWAASCSAQPDACQQIELELVP